MKSWVWIVAILVAIFYILNKYTVPSSGSQGGISGLLGFGSGSPASDVANPGTPSQINSLTGSAIGLPSTSQYSAPISTQQKITTSYGGTAYNTGVVRRVPIYTAPMYRTYAA